MQELPDKLSGYIAHQSTVKHLGNNEIVFSQGEDGRDCYFVLSGAVDSFLVNQQGKTQVLRRYGPNTLFGEVAALDGGVRRASAVARNNTRIATIRGSILLRMIREDPMTCEYILALFSQRLRESNRSFEWAKLRCASAEIAVRLLSMGHHTPGSEIAISQQALADQAGLTREYVSRILGQWSKSGWISKSRGRIAIEHPKRLIELVENQ